MGKAVDSLRILTTGNDPNKLALVGIPSSLASLVRLMDPDKPNVRAQAHRSPAEVLQPIFRSVLVIALGGTS